MERAKRRNSFDSQNSANLTGSTKTQSPAVEDDIFTMLQREESRYRSKGYGLIWAASMSVASILLFPVLGRMIWPTVLSWEIPEPYLVSALALPVSWGMQIILNIMCFVIYHLEWDFFERYKINPNPWPWKKDREAWVKLMRKSVIVVIFNNLIILPLLMLLDIHANEYKCPFSFDIESLPTPMTLLVTAPFFMIVEDCTFSSIHWLLHRKWLYPYIHKIHHTHITPVGVAAEYAHPLEFALGNILPTTIGPLLLGKHVHLFTVIVWYIFRAGETIDGHCGYEFSWSPYRLIPFSGSAEYHDFHHTHNVGNFSSFFCLWDTVWGTNTDFYKYQELKKKALELGKT